MRILLCSYWFYPSFGGVESVSEILAEQWTSAGLYVTVVTNTLGEAMDVPYKVVRRPGFAQLLKLGRQSDVIVQNIIALNTFVPLLLTGKPCVVIHASWLQNAAEKREWKHRVKRVFLRLAHNVSVSKAIADSLPVSSEVIPSPFAPSDFAGLRDRPRTKDLVFMGRLVSDKGVDTLIEALGKLQERGIKPTLTVIGDGPEMPKLRAMTKTLGLVHQVTFVGALRETRGETVAEHRIMVIPSRWAEPFGIVALEGIASGCALVASSRGGLPDAVGPCGLLFENGNSGELADALERLLKDRALQQRLVDAAHEHLRRFSPARIAGQYQELLRRLAFSLLRAN